MASQAVTLGVIERLKVTVLTSAICTAALTYQLKLQHHICTMLVASRRFLPFNWPNLSSASYYISIYLTPIQAQVHTYSLKLITPLQLVLVQ